MKMFIDGKACDSSDGKTIDVINPATGEVIDTVPSATKEDIDRAISVAVEGQKKWARDYPLHKRISIFEKFRELCTENREAIAKMLCRESGRPICEAYGDFDAIHQQVQGFSSAAQCLLSGVTQPYGSLAGAEGDFDVTVREPIGVIVSIPAFNGPINMWGKKAVPALLAGNSVIHKPPTDDPLSTLMTMELAYEAGIPGYALQVVTGRGENCGEWLSSDKRIGGVSLTGSTEVGLQVARNLINGLKYMQLELGGNAPSIICEDADVDLAVNECIRLRAVPRAGQLCSVSKRFIVHSSIKKEFVEKLVMNLKQYKTGDPMDPDTRIGTLISEKAARGVEEQVNHTIAQGAKLLYGNIRNGAYYLPTVLDDCTRDMDIAHNLEVFGPVFPIFVFDDIEEAISLANDTDYGLSSSVFTKDYGNGLMIANQLEAGNVIINGNACYGTMRSPFNGYKLSGFGSPESQTHTLLSMTEEKEIVFRHMLKR